MCIYNDVEELDVGDLLEEIEEFNTLGKLSVIAEVVEELRVRRGKLENDLEMSKMGIATGYKKEELENRLKGVTDNLNKLAKVVDIRRGDY